MVRKRKRSEDASKADAKAAKVNEEPDPPPAVIQSEDLLKEVSVRIFPPFGD